MSNRQSYKTPYWVPGKKAASANFSLAVKAKRHITFYSNEMDFNVNLNDIVNDNIANGKFNFAESDAWEFALSKFTLPNNPD